MRPGPGRRNPRLPRAFVLGGIFLSAALAGCAQWPTGTTGKASGQTFRPVSRRGATALASFALREREGLSPNQYEAEVHPSVRDAVQIVVFREKGLSDVRTGYPVTLVAFVDPDGQVAIHRGLSMKVAQERALQAFSSAGNDLLAYHLAHYEFWRGSWVFEYEENALPRLGTRPDKDTCTVIVDPEGECSLHFAR